MWSRNASLKPSGFNLPPRGNFRFPDPFHIHSEQNETKKDSQEGSLLNFFVIVLPTEGISDCLKLSEALIHNAKQ